MLNDQTLIIFFNARFASLFFHFVHAVCFIRLCQSVSLFRIIGTRAKATVLPLNQQRFASSSSSFVHSFRLVVAIVRGILMYILSVFLFEVI